jgi:hypothetical protein
VIRECGACESLVYVYSLTFTFYWVTQSVHYVERNLVVTFCGVCAIILIHFHVIHVTTLFHNFEYLCALFIGLSFHMYAEINVLSKCTNGLIHHQNFLWCVHFLKLLCQFIDSGRKCYIEDRNLVCPWMHGFRYCLRAMNISCEMSVDFI